MKRQKGRSNRHRIKALRNYTIAETSLLVGVHRRTVREWIKRGLPVLDQKRPLLIHGSDLKSFLANRKQRRKQPCQPGELFCVKCRTAKVPAGGLADYIPISPTRGSLSGICPTCNAIITAMDVAREVE
jgi:Helix-turn-helix domain